jgi:hypothetical protein
MKTIKIEVKRKHIKAGSRESGSSCPIALAVREQVVGSEPWIYPYSAQLVTDKSIQRTIDLPVRARRFIERFDSCKPVKPFSFQLKYEA